MNRARLQELANLLRTVPVGEFDLSEWKCGTSACAVGWATTHAPFVADGLKMASWTSEHFDGGGITSYVPTFQDEEGWEAVMAFFDLDEADAHELFSSHSFDLFAEASPSDVANRIEGFLEVPA